MRGGSLLDGDQNLASDLNMFFNRFDSPIPCPPLTSAPLLPPPHLGHHLLRVIPSHFKHNSSGCFLQKFSDDTVITGLIMGGEDREYRSVIRDFVD